MTWAENPILCLDFETTGTDPFTARPVSVAAAFVDGDGTVQDLDGALVWHVSEVDT